MPEAKSIMKANLDECEICETTKNLKQFPDEYDCKFWGIEPSYICEECETAQEIPLAQQ